MPSNNKMQKIHLPTDIKNKHAHETNYMLMNSSHKSSIKTFISNWFQHYKYKYPRIPKP